jgi:hypothetical protein
VPLGQSGNLKIMLSGEVHNGLNIEDTCRCTALETILHSYLFIRTILQPRFPQTSGTLGDSWLGSLVPNGAHSRGPSAVGLAKLKVAFR